jgi:hypothetical protein
MKSRQVKQKCTTIQVPSPKKEANDTDVDDNQAFSFTVKQLIPDDIDTYTEFELVDTPDRTAANVI